MPRRPWLLRVVSLRVAARLSALVVVVLLATITVLHFYLLADRRARGSAMRYLEDAELEDIVDVETRRDTVKRMMKLAWDGYKKYAWGQNELRPLTKRGYEGSFLKGRSLGVTIVDSLDTLHIMGLTEEFDLGKSWIAENFTFSDVDSYVSVFETNIRIVGGLLSCYSLTGDSMFKDIAETTAKTLLPAFDTGTGIPCSRVNPKTKLCEHPFESQVLAEYGTLSLEFNYLSDVTGDEVYRKKVDNIRQFLQQIEKPDGLYPVYLTNDTWQLESNHASVGALGDSFFEYLLKEWLRSGKLDEELKQTYEDAMSAVINNLLSTTPSGLVYFSDLKEGGLDHTMSHLACFTGGLLALGAQTLEEEEEDSEYCLVLGKGIANTCHESYSLTKSKLGPETFSFSEDDMFVEVPYYILRPEVVETYFYLWRITKDQKYREWGWEVVQALKTNCLTPNGFTGILYVNSPLSPKDDIQQSFFLAETLKYLYLLFSEDGLLPLDLWVFNTEAHPLPIKGVNNLYRGYTGE